tara:strand:+ start:364 stop:792 length:429 start_codon:yes stop_codon:yes gene_type:complete
MRYLAIALLIFIFSSSVLADAKKPSESKIDKTETGITITIIDKDGSINKYIHNYHTGKAVMYNSYKLKKSTREVYILLDKNRVAQMLILKKLKNNGTLSVRTVLRQDPKQKPLFNEIVDKNVLKFIEDNKIEEIIKKQNLRK